jgi:hypothetical protein
MPMEAEHHNTLGTSSLMVSVKHIYFAFILHAACFFLTLEEPVININSAEKAF